MSLNVCPSPSKDASGEGPVVTLCDPLSSPSSSAPSSLSAAFEVECCRLEAALRFFFFLFFELLPPPLCDEDADPEWAWWCACDCAKCCAGFRLGGVGGERVRASVTDVGASSRMEMDSGRVSGVTACHCASGAGEPFGGDMVYGVCWDEKSKQSCVDGDGLLPGLFLLAASLSVQPHSRSGRELSPARGLSGCALKVI